MSNENVHLEIVDSGLEQLSMDFIDIADNLSMIFEKLDEKFNTLEEYLDCEAMTDIKQKYDTLKANYSIIKANTLSYSEDMIILNKKMTEGEEYLVDITNRGTENIKRESKEVESWH